MASACTLTNIEHTCLYTAKLKESRNSCIEKDILYRSHHTFLSFGDTEQSAPTWTTQYETTVSLIAVSLERSGGISVITFRRPPLHQLATCTTTHLHSMDPDAFNQLREYARVTLDRAPCPTHAKTLLHGGRGGKKCGCQQGT